MFSDSCPPAMETLQEAVTVSPSDIILKVQDSPDTAVSTDSVDTHLVELLNTTAPHQPGSDEEQSSQKSTATTNPENAPCGHRDARPPSPVMEALQQPITLSLGSIFLELDLSDIDLEVQDLSDIDSADELIGGDEELTNPENKIEMPQCSSCPCIHESLASKMQHASLQVVQTSFSAPACVFHTILETKSTSSDTIDNNSFTSTQVPSSSSKPSIENCFPVVSRKGMAKCAECP